MKTVFICLCGILLTSCASFYEANLDFNQQFESGDLVAAEAALDAKKTIIKRKSEFLYYANKGTMQYMLGDYERSNVSLERAYLFGEDYRRNGFEAAASFLTNPTVEEYAGEDHEHLMLLYYKALNHLKLGDHESALVECRRMNQRLYELDDKHRADRKFDEDAYIHLLMGLIYDSSGDYNNAFIAYRNAYNIYTETYEPLFQVNAPQQLKSDLIRTAAQCGFKEEQKQYESEFGMTYQPIQAQSQLIFLWHNGLAPVKKEISMNMSLSKHGGSVNVANSASGIAYEVPWMDDFDDLGGLSFTRLTLPQYVERRPSLRQGLLKINAETYPLELAEDINAIAFKNLEQRMPREIGRSLVRLAAKKGVEYAAREENEWAGLFVSVVNASTERADTRNWQTLPYEIRYTRILLDEGMNDVKLILSGPSREGSAHFQFLGTPGKTLFHAYQTLN